MKAVTRLKLPPKGADQKPATPSGPKLVMKLFPTHIRSRRCSCSPGSTATTRIAHRDFRPLQPVADDAFLKYARSYYKRAAAE